MSLTEDSRRRSIRALYSYLTEEKDKEGDQKVIPIESDLSPQDDTAFVIDPRDLQPHHIDDFRIGDWLLRRGLIDQEDLFYALSHSRRHHCRIGDAIVELSLLDRLSVEEECKAFAAFKALLTI